MLVVDVLVVFVLVVVALVVGVLVVVAKICFLLRGLMLQPVLDVERWRCNMFFVMYQQHSTPNNLYPTKIIMS